MKTIKGILGKTDSKNVTTFTKYELEYNNFKDFQRVIDCNTFDMQTRKFGSHYFDVFCDDEGLLKDNKVPAIITQEDGKIHEIIFGSVFICKSDDEGDSVSLTEKEQDIILEQLGYIIYNDKMCVILNAEF